MKTHQGKIPQEILEGFQKVGNNYPKVLLWLESIEEEELQSMLNVVDKLHYQQGRAKMIQEIVRLFKTS